MIIFLPPKLIHLFMKWMKMMQYNEMKGYYDDKPCSEGYVISNISYNHFVNM